MTHYLLVGGLVAAGFDRTGDWLLAISHSGRGVFSTRTWERVARDSELAYPEEGKGIGIGPIEGQLINVTGIDYDSGELELTSPDGRWHLEYESGTISVEGAD